MEEILLVSIVNHTVNSVIVYSRICPRVFIHIGMEFPSDREDLLVEMCILLSLVIFGQSRKGSKVESK